MDNLEHRIQRLEAVEAIRTCIYSYAASGDRGNDPSVVRTLFAQDGSFEAVGMAAFTGLDNVVKGLEEIGRTAVLWSFHQPGGPIIKLSDDLGSARAFWWAWIAAKLKEGADDPQPLLAAANYNADLVVEAGAWKFKRVRLETKLRMPVEGPWTTPEGDFEWLV